MFKKSLFLLLSFLFNNLSTIQGQYAQLSSLSNDLFVLNKMSFKSVIPVGGPIKPDLLSQIQQGKKLKQVLTEDIVKDQAEAKAQKVIEAFNKDRGFAFLRPLTPPDINAEADRAERTFDTFQDRYTNAIAANPALKSLATKKKKTAAEKKTEADILANLFINEGGQILRLYLKSPYSLKNEVYYFNLFKKIRSVAKQGFGKDIYNDKLKAIFVQVLNIKRQREGIVKDLHKLIALYTNNPALKVYDNALQDYIANKNKPGHDQALLRLKLAYATEKFSQEEILKRIKEKQAELVAYIKNAKLTDASKQAWTDSINAKIKDTISKYPKNAREADYLRETGTTIGQAMQAAVLGKLDKLKLAYTQTSDTDADDDSDWS